MIRFSHFFPIIRLLIITFLKNNFCLYSPLHQIGSYVFLESSSPRKENDTAVMVSQQFNAIAGQKRCLNFWYHMYGSSIGSLEIIYRVYSGSKPEKVLWRLNGQQHNSEKSPWLNARVPIDMSADHSVSLYMYIFSVAWSIRLMLRISSCLKYYKIFQISTIPEISHFFPMIWHNLWISIQFLLYTLNFLLIFLMGILKKSIH